MRNVQKLVKQSNHFQGNNLLKINTNSEKINTNSEKKQQNMQNMKSCYGEQERGREGGI